MGKERNSLQRLAIVREALDEDIEEENVGFWDGKEEGTCVGSGVEVEELVGKFGGSCNVGVETVDEELSVDLG